MKTNLTEQVLKTIRNYDMLKPQDSVLVAVSGGPDSVFLLCVLIQLEGKFKIKEISVANMDHGIRGRESKADSSFVKKMSDEAGIKFIHKRVDLSKVKSSKLSTEELAREARYKFFKEAAEKVRANVIATGHTLDDQAETILMRIVKGASLKGIVGISPARSEGAFRLIRPLLEIEKKDIKRYLDSSGIAYRIDRTNLEPVYFRNVVRGEIIPFLERYNPRLKRVLSNLAEHLREDFEFIDDARSKAGMILVNKGRGVVDIALKDLVIQPRALRKEILRDALYKAGGEVKRLSFRHWKDMENFIKYKRKGNSLDLPGSIRITRTADRLSFHKI